MSDKLKELNAKIRISEIIREELEFTNGWKVSDDVYEEISIRAAKRIIHTLKRRKIIT